MQRSIPQLFQARPPPEPLAACSSRGSSGFGGGLTPIHGEARWARAIGAGEAGAGGGAGGATDAAEEEEVACLKEEEEEKAF